ncbi:MFS transporter [Kitasatospora mediocidica]|uniref:MFS transporter n=1 Tax=Kitasatospora mediocidica TaxID=58352 RepID=UPI00068CF935|nr:MFS transporter [Kitasatospora mediocidica]
MERDRGGAIALLVLLLGQAMANIDLAVVNLAAPAVSVDLRVSSTELTLMVTSYALCSAVLLAPAARLGERHGVRRVYLCGLGLFTLASLGCGLAPVPTVLIAGRCAQGAATALMISQVLVGIHRWFSGPARARALGWHALTLSGGAVLGQVLGGTLVSANLFGTGWRAVFLLNVPVGALMLAAGLRLLPHDRPSGARAVDPGSDTPGGLLLGAATLAVLLPLSLEHPWWLWLFLALVGPLGVAFVRTERRVIARGGRPALDLAALGTPAVRWSLLAFCGTTLTYIALLYLLALHLEQHLRLPAWQAGLVPLGWVIAFGAAGSLLPRAPRRLARRLPMAGCLLLTLSYALAAVVPAGRGLAVWPLTVVLCVGGFGLGLAHTSLLVLLTSSVPARSAPDLSGTVNTLSTVVGVIGVAVFGALYPWLGGQAWSGPAGSWRLTCGGLALVAAGSAVSALAAVRGATASEGSADPTDHPATPPTNTDPHKEPPCGLPESPGTDRATKSPA